MSESRNEVSGFAGAVKAALAANKLSMLQSEVERLTAELADEKIHAVEATGVIIEAQAREKKLRAITGEMLDLHSDGIVTWVRVCNEWDRRAGEVT